jgi:hypothetical protein
MKYAVILKECVCRDGNIIIIIISSSCHYVDSKICYKNYLSLCTKSQNATTTSEQLPSVSQQ